MAIILRIIGIAAILMGLLWVGQGTGRVMWPASSFMLAQRQWALWGMALIVLGGMLILRSRRQG